MFEVTSPNNLKTCFNSLSSNPALLSKLSTSPYQPAGYTMACMFTTTHAQLATMFFSMLNCMHYWSLGELGMGLGLGVGVDR